MQISRGETFAVPPRWLLCRVATSVRFQAWGLPSPWVGRSEVARAPVGGASAGYERCSVRSAPWLCRAHGCDMAHSGDGAGIRVDVLAPTALCHRRCLRVKGEKRRLTLRRSVGETPRDLINHSHTVTLSP